MTRLSTSFVVLACALFLTGCGFAATRNVRAFRAYANEDANIAVALDRTEDLAESLRLIDDALTKTPYKPGDKWVSMMILSDERAAKLKEQIRSQPPYSTGDYEVPVVKLYRMHLEKVLEVAKAEHEARAKAAEPKPEEPKAEPKEGDADAGAPTDDAGAGSGGEEAKKDEADAGTPSEPKKDEASQASATALAEGEYACVLDAMGELAPGAGSLKSQWDELEKAEVKLEEAKTAEDKLYHELIASGRIGNNQQTPQELLDAQAVTKAADEVVDKARKAIAASVEALKKIDPKDPKRAVLVRDSLAASTVALRVDLEALALIPIVIVQAARSVGSAPKDLMAQRNLKVVDQISELPARGEQIEERLQHQLAVLQEMANALSGLTGKDVADTAAFQMKESVVDQVVGVGLDSFRVNLKAGGEALFFAFDAADQYSSQTTTTQSSDGSTSSTTTTKDYHGRTRRLEYAVDPIWLIQAKLNVGFDFLHLPNAANVNLGFATDRAWGGGGTIDTSKGLAKELGVEGVASDVIDAGLGILGVKSKVTLATFTAGEVTRIDIDPSSDAETVRDSAPLQLSLTQIDIGYDMSFLFPEFAGRYWIEELSLAFKYMDYRLPRALYEMEDQNSSTKDSDWTLVREGPPQMVNSTYYMGGFLFRLGQGTAPIVSIFGDLGLFFGAGPTEYYLRKDQANLKNSESNREYFTADAFAVTGAAGLGLRVRITPKKSRIRLSADAEYQGEVIYQSIQTQGGEVENDVETKKPRQIDYGGADVFHGPRLNLLGSF